MSGQTHLNDREWDNGQETPNEYSKPLTPRYKHPAGYRITPAGYEEAHTGLRGKKHRFFIHKLIAVSEFGFEAVKDMVVHHKNGVPWDNRPSNLELMTHAEHSSHHYTDYRVEKVDGEKCDLIRSNYPEKPIEDLAHEFSMSISGIWKHLNGECKHATKALGPGYDGPRNGPWRDEKPFKKHYLDEGMTQAELAELWDCSKSTVSKWAREHGISK